VISKLQYISGASEGRTHEQNIELVCDAGCRWIQLRMKDVSQEEYLQVALRVREITRRYNAILIINDNPHVALHSKADGLHIGRTDLSIQAARDIVGDELIIGGSTNSIEDIREAVRNGFDYAGIGPFRFTTTKKNLNPVLGLEGISGILKQVKNEGIKLPLVAIGGITENDAESLMNTGVYGLAVSSAITSSVNTEVTVRKFHSLIQGSVQFKSNV
jgi:thiamine-phosphate pyrophosphorylase